jgi:hypothetical protein
MVTDSQENSLLANPVAFVASEDPQSLPENSGRISAHASVESAEEFYAEQVAADARSVAIEAVYSTEAEVHRQIA